MDNQPVTFRFDDLQGRQAFIDALESRCDTGPANDYSALLLVRLLKLRAINARYGYDVGDWVISEFIARVKNTLRDTDSLAFFGDHTLAVCIPQLDNPTHVILPANKISSLFDQPMDVAEEPVNASVAIGVALAPLHADNPAALVKAAEAALYVSRREGDRYVLFDETISDSEVQRIALIDDLKQAIETGDLNVCFQPQISLENDRLYGFESLLRWRSDKHGDVPPDTFIGLAEQAGLIFELSKWSIFASLKHFKKISTEMPGLKLSFNISPVLLDDHDIVQVLQNAISIWDVPAENLVLEVTEGVIIRDQERSLEVMQRLRKLGCEISLDDFGTGFSSLSYLHRMPVSELKLDKSFIIGLEGSAESLKMVRAIISLGHHFDLRVVAEGVETEGVCKMLKGLDCEIGQGYYFARPVPVEDIHKWSLGASYV